MKLARLAALVPFAASSLLAQHEAAQPERPTVATHAGTVAPGSVEIETGVERDRISRATSLQSPTVFKLGVASHVQLSVYESILHPSASSTSLGDLEVGVKWRIADHSPIGDLAILPAIKLPTGSVQRGAGSGTTDLSLLGIASRDVGPIHIDANLGYTRRGGDGTVVPKNASVWTTSFGGSVVNRLGWVAEAFGYPATTGPAHTPSIVSILGGPTFTAWPWLVVDAGLISPLAGPQPHALYFGAVYNAGHIR